MSAPLSGVIPPLVTPLKPNRSLDEAGLARVIDHCVAGGCSGIFVAGSTGEVSGMSRSLWTDLVRTAVGLVKGRVPVLAGIVDNATEQCAEMAEIAAKAGADYVVAATTYYLKHGPDEHMLHFKELARRSPLPVVVYNVPGATGGGISPATMLRLTEVPNLVGLKDSSGDIETFTLLAPALAAAGWRLFLGTETLNHVAPALGAHGTIPGLANIAPAWCSEAFRLGAAGRAAEAMAVQHKVNKLREIIFMGEGGFSSGALGAFKISLNLLGLCDTTVTLPLAAQSDAVVGQVRKVLSEVGLLA